jgi:hypothetical protein
MTAPAQLGSWAAALGGDVSGHGVLCPGPGHSRQDRSLSVMPSATAPDGFIVHSFSGDDPIACKDYVRARLGQPEFKPNGHAKPPKKTYFDYRNEHGTLVCQVERTDYSDGRKKKFLQRRPDGNDGWIWNLDGVHPAARGQFGSSPFPQRMPAARRNGKPRKAQRVRQATCSRHPRGRNQVPGKLQPLPTRRCASGRGKTGLQLLRCKMERR